jgi:hypothetical protein
MLKSKKKLSTLHLTRETIRALQVSLLKGVIGGRRDDATGTNCTTCPDDCI